MKHNAVRIISLLLLIFLAACNNAAEEADETTETAETNETVVDDDAQTETETESPSQPAFGPGSGMMQRHHAAVPEAYAGLTNPIPAEEESIERGAEIYDQYCVSCHGEDGMGDGPAAANIDPAPAPIAHTSRMLGDDYLFWRISEGGHEFQTAMPSWEAALDEQARWDVINYVRALSGSAPMPGGMMGRGMMGGDALAVEEEQRAEMLARAVEQDVLTQAEADLFDTVHGQLDQLSGNMNGRMGNMEQIRLNLLDQLVAAGELTQADADAFNNIHDRLIEAGLMQ